MAQLTAEQRIEILESKLRRQRMLVTVLMMFLVAVVLWLVFVSRYIGWPQASLIMRADRVLTKELIVTDDNGDFALFVNGAKGGGTLHMYGSHGRPAMTLSSFDQTGGKITLYDQDGKETFAAPAGE